MVIKKKIKKQIRRKTVRRRFKFFLRTSLILIFIALSVWGIFNTKVLSVRNVNILVVGYSDPREATNLRLDIQNFIDAEFKKRVYLLRGSTRYLFSSSNIETLLTEEFSLVSRVEISWKFFNLWNVVAVKRDVRYQACSEGDGKCYFIDENGVPFLEAEVLDLDLKIFSDVEPELLKPVSSPETFKKLNLILDFLNENFIYIKEIHLSNELDEIVLITTSDIEITISSEESVYETTRALYIIFKELNQDNVEFNFVDIVTPNVIKYGN